MTTIRMNLTSTSSKAEEIAFLRRLAKAIPEGAYLKGLFSAQLLNWVEQEITSDFVPDVIGRMEWIERTDRDNAAEKHAADSAEIARTHTALQNALDDLRTAGKKADRLSGINESLNAELNALREQRQDLYQRVAELYRAIDEQQAQIVALQENVKAVKVLAANKMLGIDTTAADSQSDLLAKVIADAKQELARHDQICNDDSSPSYRKDAALAATAALRRVLSNASIDA